MLDELDFDLVRPLHEHRARVLGVHDLEDVSLDLGVAFHQGVDRLDEEPDVVEERFLRRERVSGVSSMNESPSFTRVLGSTRGSTRSNPSSTQRCALASASATRSETWSRSTAQACGIPEPVQVEPFADVDVLCVLASGLAEGDAHQLALRARPFGVEERQLAELGIAPDERELVRLLEDVDVEDVEDPIGVGFAVCDPEGRRGRSVEVSCLSTTRAGRTKNASASSAAASAKLEDIRPSPSRLVLDVSEPFVEPLRRVPASTLSERQDAVPPRALVRRPHELLADPSAAKPSTTAR